VSPAGRQRTIDVSGEPLTPRQVVQRICSDVRATGIDAVLDYTRRINGATVTRDDLFATPCASPGPTPPSSPTLATIRRIRARIERFQQAVLARDVTVPLAGGGSLGQRYLPLDRAGICVPGGGRPPIPRRSS